ncbi:MAG TPA: hypothetical protein VI076_14700 [Actinopolymorphaceae bacterium]
MARIRRWGDQRLAGASERLAEAVAWGETAADRFLPRQPVHGFWDNNVFCHGERLVHVADFDFMAERARIDDLALTLYFADHEFGQTRTIGSQPCGHSWRRTTVASSAE